MNCMCIISVWRARFMKVDVNTILASRWISCVWRKWSVCHMYSKLVYSWLIHIIPKGFRSVVYHLNKLLWGSPLIVIVHQSLSSDTPEQRIVWLVGFEQCFDPSKPFFKPSLYIIHTVTIPRMKNTPNSVQIAQNLSTSILSSFFMDFLLYPLDD